MYIKFERTGGFTGVSLQTDIESSSLLEEQADKLEQLIHETQFFNLPERLEAPQDEADRFCYRIFVDDGYQQHAVEAGESAVPDELWPLLQWLTRLAHKG